MRPSRLGREMTIEWEEAGRACLFLGGSGDAFLVNPAGGFVLARLQEGCRDGAVAARLAKTFGISRARAAKDLETFLVRLRNQGIVPNEE